MPQKTTHEELMNELGKEQPHESVPLTPREDIEKELNDALAKVDEYHDRLLRVEAEKQNIERRYEKRLADVSARKLKEFVLELLPVVDSFERALEKCGEDIPEQYLAGMKGTLDLMMKALGRFGVQLIDPEGKRFDHHLHEAISTEESELETNTVVRVLQKGYALKDVLIRPAMVVVAK